MAATEQTEKPGRKLRARPPRTVITTAKERRTISVEHRLDRHVFGLAEQAQRTYSSLAEDAMLQVYGRGEGDMHG